MTTTGNDSTVGTANKTSGSSTEDSPVNSDLQDATTAEAKAIAELQELFVELQAIRKKRLDAFASGTGRGLSTKEHLDLAVEATTVEDIRTIHHAFSLLDEFSSLTAELYGELQREWGYKRCGVCGMTPQQSEAIGYDCVQEC